MGSASGMLAHPARHVPEVAATLRECSRTGGGVFLQGGAVSAGAGVAVRGPRGTATRAAQFGGRGFGEVGQHPRHPSPLILQGSAIGQARTRRHRHRGQWGKDVDMQPATLAPLALPVGVRVGARLADQSAGACHIPQGAGGQRQDVVMNPPDTLPAPFSDLQNAEGLAVSLSGCVSSGGGHVFWVLSPESARRYDYGSTPGARSGWE